MSVYDELREKAFKRKPVFDWNAKVDVERAREFLESAIEHGTEVASDTVLKQMRDFGISPTKCVAMMKEAAPGITGERYKQVQQYIMHFYATTDGIPGKLATGDEKQEQSSDGEWLAVWSKTKRRVLKEWQWISDSMQFVHDDGKQFMNDKQFRRQFGSLIKNKDVMTAIDRRELPLKRFIAQVYIPKKPHVVRYKGQPPMSYSGKVVFNTWRDSGMKPIDFGDFDWFLEHVARLFPNDVRSQGLLLDYMAQLVKHPEVKINFALLLQSREGAGKGALGHILRRIIGARNVVEPTPDEFMGQFNNWQENAQLAIVAEVMLDGQKDVAERLKKPITDDTLRIHKKFGNPFTIPNHLNFFCMTNHKDAVPMGTHDRRWLVLASTWRPSPGDRDYFQKLWADIEDREKVASVMGFLLNHRITMNPKGHAPMTEAKAEMQERAKSDIGQQLKARLELRDGPFAFPVVRREDVVAWLQQHGHKFTKGLAGEVGTFFDDVDAVELRRYKHGKDGVPQYRLYAVYDQANHNARPPFDVAREYHTRTRVVETDGTNPADDFE